MISTYRVKTISERKDIPGFETINVLSWHKKDTPYYTLSPYHLKTDGNEENANIGGIIFENFWQFSKLYREVEETKQYVHHSRIGDPKFLTWEWPHEEHVNKDNQIDWNKYLKWRITGFNCKKPVRRPNGNSQHKCITSLVLKNDNTGFSLSYIEARKRIYKQEYIRLIKSLPEYKIILNKFLAGVNICIQEIDIPSIGKKGYYGKLCREDGLYIADINSLDLLLNDDSEAFGHGLCLIYALLEDTN